MNGMTKVNLAESSPLIHEENFMCCSWICCRYECCLTVCLLLQSQLLSLQLLRRGRQRCLQKFVSRMPLPALARCCFYRERLYWSPWISNLGTSVQLEPPTTTCRLRSKLSGS